VRRVLDPARALLQPRTRRRRPVPGAAARAVTVHPSDVFVVSYPRSGNTWLRFLLANALRPERQVTFETVGNVVPDIYDEADAALLGHERPRILKSHEPFDHRYRHVAYVVRHPVDVAASYYRYLTKVRVLEPGHDRARFVSSFIAGDCDGFGPWGEHVLGWLDERAGTDYFLLLRYEELLERAEEKLSQVLAIARVEVLASRLSAAVARSTAAELRRLEREAAMSLPSFRQSRPEIPFIGPARSGAGVEVLGQELATEIVAAWPEAIARAGYGATGGSK
jgi:hypothetical protein